MELFIGLVFTGKWFTGRVEVLEIKEQTNELMVQLHSNYEPKENDHQWNETWNLFHTKVGFKNGDYFLKQETNKE